MNAASLHHFTRCGLPGVDVIPFGMHACHFYSNRDQLVAALVPFFVEGLRANERCLWITVPELSAREAIQELRAAWEGIDDAIHDGAIRILDFHRWYAGSAGLKGLEVVQFWLGEEERALAEGFSGLRIAGNTSFLKPDDWSAFMEYERAVTERFKDRRIVALCSYVLAQCGGRHMGDVLHAHHCAFERMDGDWQVVAAPPPAGGPETKPQAESIGRTP